MACFKRNFLPIRKQAMFFVLLITASIYALLVGCAGNIAGEKPPPGVRAILAPQIGLGSIWEYEVSGMRKVYRYKKEGDPTSPYVMRIPFPLWIGAEWSDRKGLEDWTGTAKGFESIKIAEKKIEVMRLAIQQHGAISGMLLLEGVCLYSPELKTLVNCDFKYYPPVKEGHGYSVEEKKLHYPSFRLMKYRLR